MNRRELLAALVALPVAGIAALQKCRPTNIVPTAPFIEPAAAVKYIVEHSYSPHGPWQVSGSVAGQKPNQVVYTRVRGIQLSWGDLYEEPR